MPKVEISSRKIILKQDIDCIKFIEGRKNMIFLSHWIKKKIMKIFMQIKNKKSVYVSDIIHD